MTKPTRLRPVDAPAPDVSPHDRIMASLLQAMVDQEKDEELGQSALGIAIIWLRGKEDGLGNSWIIQGMNGLEAIGLLKVTADDISNCGLHGAPDHFDGEA